MSHARSDRPRAAVAPAGARAPAWSSAWVVVPVLAAAVFASRGQAIALDGELNPDESQMLAQVMRLGVDRVPWRGMDGTTSGPLNTWFLAAAHAVGMPLRYPWAHALAAAVLALACVLVYATLRQVTSRAVAAAGGAAAALSVVLAQGANYTHFSSELVPALLTALAILCLALRHAHPKQALALELLAAVLAGILPWTKLQSSLGAAVLVLWLAASILRSALPPARAWGRLALVVAAAALPSAVILGVVLAGGAWSDFRMSYVVANAAYVGGIGVRALPGKLLRLFAAPPSRLLAGTAGLALAWAWSGRPGWRLAAPPLRELLAGTAALSAATTLAVLLPRVPFAHYQILLIAPLALLCGAVLAAWAIGGAPPRAAATGWTAFALAAALLPLAALPDAVLRAHEMATLRAGADTGRLRRLARDVRALAPGASSMVVWGWTPSLYVETGMTPATRHAVCHFVIQPSPAREHLRSSFLADVRRERPDVVVDAVAAGCFGWGWGPDQRLGSFPALADYVRREYVLVGELGQGVSGEPVRVYVSRACLAATDRPQALPAGKPTP